MSVPKRVIDIPTEAPPEGKPPMEPAGRVEAREMSVQSTLDITNKSAPPLRGSF
jgi:hypothetical protein